MLDIDDWSALLQNGARKYGYGRLSLRRHCRSMADRPFDIADRLPDFAVSVCKIAKSFPNDRLGSHVAGQLIRSGTAPAANYAEAQAAESRKDFIHKMKLVLKELRESLVWLRLAQRINLNAARSLGATAAECDELIAIFFKCIDTARKNRVR